MDSTIFPQRQTMSNSEPEIKKLYSSADDLHPLHWKAVAERDPVEAARAAGCSWDNDLFTVEFLGQGMTVDPAGKTIGFVDEPERQVGYQRGLVILSYLANVMEFDPSGRWVAFRELKGGEGFFRGPHEINTRELEKVFGNDLEGLKKSALHFGGAEAEGGDMAVEFDAFKRIPIKVLLWKGTEEFPASAAMLIDSRAGLHLKLDVLWALSNVAVADLVRLGEVG